MSLRSRIDALEAVVGRIDKASEPLLILGGLVEDNTGDIASVSGEHLERGADETPDAFRVRIMARARRMRAVPLFGGLPNMPRDEVADDEDGEVSRIKGILS